MASLITDIVVPALDAFRECLVFFAAGLEVKVLALGEMRGWGGIGGMLRKLGGIVEGRAVMAEPGGFSPVDPFGELKRDKGS